MRTIKWLMYTTLLTTASSWKITYYSAEGCDKENAIGSNTGSRANQGCKTADTAGGKVKAIKVQNIPQLTDLICTVEVYEQAGCKDDKGYDIYGYHDNGDCKDIDFKPSSYEYACYAG